VKKYILFSFLLLSIIISCTTTNVKLQTDPTGYNVHYNDEYIGKTPCEFKASNLFWKKHEVIFSKNDSIIEKVQLKEESKWGNICGWGWLYGLGLLWAYGPLEKQAFIVGKSKLLITNSDRKTITNKPNKHPGDKFRVAVMDFQAKGVSNSLAKNISEVIRNELITYNEFIVVERTQVDKILKEIGFQQSGCTDVSCAVKIGQMLSANKILIGNLMKVGKKIIITGRLVDVEKGIGVSAANQSASSEDDLDDAVKIFIRKLANYEN
jgi:TolB-like protein